MPKTIGTWIIILVVIGSTYYAADKVLTNVETTIDQTVIHNVLVTREHIDALQLSGSTDEIITTWEKLWNLMNSWSISLSQNIAWADTGSINEY
jgi:hypothetical protein